jgi:hypothetical protein
VAALEEVAVFAGAPDFELAAAEVRVEAAVLVVGMAVPRAGVVVLGGVAVVALVDPVDLVEAVVLTDVVVDVAGPPEAVEAATLPAPPAAPAAGKIASAQHPAAHAASPNAKLRFDTVGLLAGLNVGILPQGVTPTTGVRMWGTNDRPGNTGD